ncbi:MAG: hypothetical protein JXA13_09555 [Anaerolineales bacterium]|nr:hypothetical protein [Anaerolineales bacterium]
MKEKATIQETSTVPDSFETRTQKWDAEIGSIDKWVGRLQGGGAIAILVGLFPLWFGLSMYEMAPAVVGILVIIAAAALLMQTTRVRKEKIKKLISDIQQTCQEDGFDKAEVVKALFRKPPDQARSEILRAVDLNALARLLSSAAARATSIPGQIPAGYFESQPPESDGLCSDDECPCASTLILRGQGYLYIPPGVVKMRRDARTLNDLRIKLARTTRRDPLASDFRYAALVPRQGVYHPILMCRQGAERRGIDLDVAAKDAAYWWETGFVPLRPTPIVKA